MNIIDRDGAINWGNETRKAMSQPERSTQGQGQPLTVQDVQKALSLANGAGPEAFEYVNWQEATEELNAALAASREAPVPHIETDKCAENECSYHGWAREAPVPQSKELQAKLLRLLETGQHNDTCSYALSEEYACDCWKAKLAAAIGMGDK